MRNSDKLFLSTLSFALALAGAQLPQPWSFLLSGVGLTHSLAMVFSGTSVGLLGWLSVGLSVIGLLPDYGVAAAVVAWLQWLGDLAERSAGETC